MRKNQKYKIIGCIIGILIGVGLCYQGISLAKEEAMVQTNSSQTLKNGEYTICSAVNTKYVLDIAGGSQANGANVQLFEESKVPQQVFMVKYLGNDCYSITAKHSNKALDVAGRRKEARNQYMAISNKHNRCTKMDSKRLRK